MDRLRRIAPMPTPGQTQSHQQQGLGVSGCALMAMKEICDSVTMNGRTRSEMATRLVDLGIMQCIVDNIRAFEMQGAAAVASAAVSHSWYCTWFFLAHFDWTAPELEPVAEMLRREVRAVRFALDHEQYQCCGSGTSTHTTAVAACVFGKEDAGEETLVFSQANIDDILAFAWETLRPGAHPLETAHWGHLIQLELSQAQPFLSLCISDSHKQLLLANPHALTHLLHGLMLDPAHHRSDEADITDFEGVKAAVQKDYAECLQQLSLFPEGREAMIRDPAVIEALRELVSAGCELCWSDEARRCALGALMALEGRDHSTAQESAPGAGDRWVMLSYSWEYQKTFVRLNEALRDRSYVTWIDLEQMKGSTMDSSKRKLLSKSDLVFAQLC